MSAKQITVDGVTYYSTKPEPIDSPIKIVILQRGWIMVGRYEQKGDACKLYNASVIRNWGTTQGLGEIAKNGPTESTKLDKCYGVVEFDNLTKVCSISCEEKVWEEKL